MPAYKDKARGTWYLKFRYTNWKNEVKEKKKRGFKTKREALEWENDFKNKEIGNLDISLEKFIEMYREDIEPRIKESTLDTKNNIINKHILPYFKGKTINKISKSDIIAWQNTLLARKDENGKRYSLSYLKTVHNQLSAIFNHGVKYYDLRDNPASIVGNMGTDNGIEMKFWTEKEFELFIETMMEEHMAYYAFELLYWSGIREGELLALKVKDINFESKELNINKTFHKIKGKEIITDPKTTNSIRTVILPDFLCDEMKNYISMLYGINEDDRIFPTTKDFLTRRIHKGAKKAGIKEIRVHDLRHSHVSLLIHMGFNVVDIGKRVGHKSADITYRYAHMFPSAQVNMADKLNNIRERDI